MVNQYKEKIRRFDFTVKIVILDDEPEFSKILDKKIKAYCARKDLLYTGLRFLRFVLYTASNPVYAAPGQRTPGGASDLQSSSQGLPDCSQRPLRGPECPQRQLHAEHGLPNYESHRLLHHISDKCCNNKRSDPEHCYVCACAQP